MSQSVDTLISSRWLIPVVPAHCILEHHSLIINNGAILDILPTKEARDQYQATESFTLGEHVIIPGLINAHGHAAMTLMRGFADDMPLQDWLEKKIWPTEAKWLDEDFVRDGTALAVAEMLRSGTTCFSDMYFFPDVAASVAQNAGIRAQLSFPILEFPSAWAAEADEYISKGLQTRDDFKNDPTIQFAFGPHAPYTNSEATLEKISMLAAELDASVHIHLHETKTEVEQSLSEHGQRPLQRLNNMGLLSPRLQCVHMTCLNDGDIQLLADTGAHVIHCPESNMKLASGICPVSQLKEAGVNVALGTDGAASNNDLDLFGEMRSAALLAKVSSGNPSVLTAHETLKMATLDGARALGIQETTGSLEVGKRADIVAVQLSELETQPLYDPCSQLVYTNNAHRVSHTWVDGRALLKDRQLVSLSSEELTSKAEYWRAKIHNGKVSHA